MQVELTVSGNTVVLFVLFVPRDIPLLQTERTKVTTVREYVTLDYLSFLCSKMFFCTKNLRSHGSLSIHPSTHLSTYHLPTHSSNHLLIHSLVILLPIQPCTHPSSHPSIHTPTHSSIHPPNTTWYSLHHSLSFVPRHMQSLGCTYEPSAPPVLGSINTFAPPSSILRCCWLTLLPRTWCLTISFKLIT